MHYRCCGESFNRHTSDENGPIVTLLTSIPPDGPRGPFLGALYMYIGPQSVVHSPAGLGSVYECASLSIGVQPSNRLRRPLLAWRACEWGTHGTHEVPPRPPPSLPAVIVTMRQTHTHANYREKTPCVTELDLPRPMGPCKERHLLTNSASWCFAYEFSL